jgi:hypothetical protein
VGRHTANDKKMAHNREKMRAKLNVLKVILVLYRSGGARKVPLEVLHLILRYYSRLAISTDSYVQVFFCFARTT